MEEGKPNANTTGTNAPDAAGIRTQANINNAERSRRAKASTRTSGSITKDKPQRSRNGSTAKPSGSQGAAKTNWHHSGTTVFILGSSLIGVLSFCGAVYLANHHELRAWMVAADFVLGIISTYVLMDGNDA